MSDTPRFVASARTRIILTLCFACWVCVYSHTALAQVNVAAASHGATAVATSTYSANYPASAVIDGDRTGRIWGAGGAWANAVPSQTDTVTVIFNGAQTIHEVDVFSLQDAYTTPVQPTLTDTFTLYGLTDFTLEWSDGATWQAIGSVAGNPFVWRRITFAPITAVGLRITITGSLNGYSRLVELEAWTMPAEPHAQRLLVSGQSNLAGELPFLAHAYAGDIYNVWQIATSIHGWDDGAPLWNSLMSLITHGPFDAFVWWQGESDAVPVVNTNYLADLQSFAARVRAATGEPHLPVIIVRVLHYPELAPIRAAEEQFVATDGHAVLIDSDAYQQLGATNYHLSDAGYAQMASRIVAAVP